MNKTLTREQILRFRAIMNDEVEATYDADIAVQICDMALALEEQRKKLEGHLAGGPNVRQTEAVTPWIPVSERLPDTFGDVAIYINGRDGVGVTYTYFADGEFGIYDDSITHWMPLPPPPGQSPDVTSSNKEHAVVPSGRPQHETPPKHGNVSAVGNGKVSVPVADIVNSPKVQRQVQAARELRDGHLAGGPTERPTEHPASEEARDAARLDWLNTSAGRAFMLTRNIDYSDWRSRIDAAMTGEPR